MHDAASDHSSIWIQLIQHPPSSIDKLSYWRDIREQWMTSLNLPPDSALLLCSAQGIQSKHHLITMIYDELLRAAAEYIEEILEHMGYGKPPAAYAFVQFGSGGRKEMTPWSDQDHGLIWASVEGTKQEEIEHYFIQWGQKYTEAVTALGFPPCTGNVLASNPEWRGSISQWIERTSHWMTDLGWESMRTLTMAFDMRTVYGDSRLEYEWRNALKMLQGDQHLPISQAIIANLLHRKRAQNSFGQLIRERYGKDAGQFDIKYRLYVPIAQMTRATAWLYGIYDQYYSTSERMDCLMEMPIPEDLKLIVSDIRNNWHIISAIRLMAAGHLADEGWQSSGMVDLGLVSAEKKQVLKHISQASTRWMRWLERRGGHER